jgi:fructoselysine 6-kinase
MDREALLFGAVSLDIYIERGVVLPGGGALNMAWHWRAADQPFRLLTRIGVDRPEVFLEFFDRHRIPYLPASIVGDGPSASIDIVIQPDGQPWMDHFVDGVWSAFRLTAEEEAAIASASSLHTVLTEGVIAELERLGRADRLSHLAVSADFLDFRHYTVERFDDTMGVVDIGFVGWPGALDDPTLDGIRGVAAERQRLVIVTLGSRGVIVIDGRRRPSERLYPVTAIPVVGTTVGCGDAFIAGFLAAYHRDGDIDGAVRDGAVAGARATAWDRPLPDAAYGPGVGALRRAAT